uniref:Fgenesh protein 72 n=1 Tax=Beta vulgaris TaxID=161934 RepID=Q1ZY16_BETVU|nr:Fgenesh protein 72 [Beta vulgaris]
MEQQQRVGTQDTIKRAAPLTTPTRSRTRGRENRGNTVKHRERWRHQHASPATGRTVAKQVVRGNIDGRRKQSCKGKKIVMRLGEFGVLILIDDQWSPRKFVAKGDEVTKKMKQEVGDEDDAWEERERKGFWGGSGVEVEGVGWQGRGGGGSSEGMREERGGRR